MTRSSMRRREWRKDLAEERRGHPARVEKSRPFGRVLRVDEDARGFKVRHATRGTRVVSRLPAGLLPAIMTRRAA